MTYIPESPGTYQGNQVIINSDRLLFNAKSDSILLFSNEVIGFSTNGSFHFDTSSDENKSKFIVNSPKIYLGLEFDNSYPEEPAVLGNELETILKEILDLIGDAYYDMAMTVTHIGLAPGSPTAPNPANGSLLSARLAEIEMLKQDIQDIKSQNTKLV